MTKNLQGKKSETFTKLLYISFALFLLILIWGIYFKANRFSGVIKNYKKLANKTPWERFTYDIIPFVRFSRKDFILNMLAFAPFGIYLPLIFKKHTHLKGFITCFLVSLSVELLQFITIVGTFSTNDLIANSLGYFIGAVIFAGIVKLLSPKIINVVNGAIITFATPFVIYAFINTATHFSVYVTKTLL